MITQQIIFDFRYYLDLERPLVPLKGRNTRTLTAEWRRYWYKTLALQQMQGRYAVRASQDGRPIQHRFPHSRQLRQSGL